MSLIENKPLLFEKAMNEQYPEIVQNEMQIFLSEKTNSTERLSGVQQKIEQRQYELKELEIKEKTSYSNSIWPKKMYLLQSN